MAATVAAFLHNEAPHGGLVLQSADSTDSRDWSVGFMIEVSHLLDSLRLRTPGDSVVGGTVTFSGLQTFEQPFGGIPRQLLQLRMTETTCIGSPGSGRYLSGTAYAVRLFTRGISLYADIDYVETPEGVCG